jgi:hypothetical protein
MLLFADGFDDYDSRTDLGNFGGWYSIGTSCDISSTVAIGSGKSLKIGINTPAVYQFSAAQDGNTLYIGFRLYYDILPGSDAYVFQVYNSAGSAQCSLKFLTTGGHLSAYAGTSGVTTLLATGATSILVDTWYYVELKIKVADSGGIFDCHISGASEFTFSGDTQGQSTNSVSRIAFHNNIGSTIMLIDDMYVFNSVGTKNITYMHDGTYEPRVGILHPNGDNSVQFASTGADNYTVIDDLIGAPNDADYIYDATSGHKSKMSLEDLSNIYSVAGVILNTRAQKSDVGAKSAKFGIDSGGTEQKNTYALTTGFANYLDVFETSDGSTTDFTSSTITSLLSMVEVL